jgi:hypothetical protein
VNPTRFAAVTATVVALGICASSGAAAQRETLALACSNREGDDPRYVSALVPGWRDRYFGMTIGLERGKRGSSRVRVTSDDGPTGIDQAVRLPRKPFSVHVEGRAVAGVGRLIMSYSDEGNAKEDERPLRLRGGRQTERFRLPAGEGRVGVMIAVVQLKDDETLDLDRIRLLVDGQRRQYLRNSELRAHACPPLPPRASAANVLPGWLRLLGTAALLILGALTIRTTGNALAQKA